MDKQLVGLPADFRDVLCEEAARRRLMEAELAALYMKSGFREIVPSILEFLDLYTRGNQSARGRALRFLNREDHLVALRADFTPAIARIAAGPLSEENLPLKLWYSGSVIRRGVLGRGNPAEIYQIGGELIGDSSPDADAEILGLVLESIDQLGVGDFVLHVNHAGVFGGILNELKLSRAALTALKAEIDRKDVRGLSGRFEELGVRPELQAQIRRLSGLIGPESVLEEALKVLTNEESRTAVLVLKELASRLSRWHSRLTFDLTEIDDLEYYTGIMFEAFVPQVRKEIGKGGRYDTLLREFGRDLPAVGFSLSLDALAELR
jgi:ATP phosphoribosyltransferase regulatory subunit